MRINFSLRLNKNIIEQSTIVNTSQKESERKKVFNQNMGAFVQRFKKGDTTLNNKLTVNSSANINQNLNTQNLLVNAENIALVFSANVSPN